MTSTTSFSPNESILLVGATGYIGLEFGLNFPRSNYSVYGTARSIEKDKLKDFSVVIDFTGDPKISNDIVEKLLELNGYTKYIFISGIWVHGSSNDEVDEFAKPNLDDVKDLVKWRLNLENEFLALKDKIPLIILRPGIIFGNNAPIWSFKFQQILDSVLSNKSEDLDLSFNSNLETVFIHNDDLSNLAIEIIKNIDDLLNNTDFYKLSILNVTNNELINIPNLIKNGSKILDFKGKINFIGEPSSTENILLNAFNTNVKTNNTRAKSFLNWEQNILY